MGEWIILTSMIPKLLEKSTAIQFDSYGHTMDNICKKEQKMQHIYFLSLQDHHHTRYSKSNSV